jgi:serine/threonine-protein kinase
MPPASPCPDVRDLQRLQAGELPAAEVERLAQHLEECVDCPQLIAQLSGEDLLARRDTPVDVACGPESPGVLDNLLRRLRSQAVSPTTTPPVAAASRYRPLRLHAKGGLGEVHLAQDEELHRPVALKRIQDQHADHAEYRRRFLREAEIAALLEHPGVVPVHGLVHDANGQPAYAMRFVQGQTLQDAVSAYHAAAGQQEGVGGRRLTFRQLLGHFVAVCNTVAYAHSRGVLHRDLKPANILLGKYGETLVVDWGLAKVTTRTVATRADAEAAVPTAEDPSPDATGLGQVVGTPAYMSPEQAAGRWDVVGPASDVYSLGATLYHLLTGRAAFQGSSTPEVLSKVQRGELLPPRQANPAVPAELDAICRKAMARKPEDRYPTPLGLAEDVEHWLADEPVSAVRESRLSRLRRWGRRHRTLVWAGVALLLTCLVSLALGLWVVLQERAQTLAERDKALRAVQDYLTLVSESRLLNVPGMQPLRRELLETALKYYQQFASQYQDDPARQIEVAAAKLRLAQIYAETDEPAAAVEPFRAGMAILENQLARPRRPISPDFLEGIYHGRLRLSVVQEDSPYRALPAEAASELQRAQRVWERLAQENPAIPGLRHDLGGIHNTIGLVQQTHGQSEQAIQSFRQALAIWDELAREYPQVPDYRSDQYVTHANMADVYRRRRELEKAIAERDTVLRLNEALMRDHPEVPYILHDRACSLYQLGSLHLQRGPGGSRQGEEYLQKAHALLQQLATNWSYPVDLATIRSDLGKACCQRGALPEALEHHNAAVLALQQLIQDRPSLAGGRTALARALTHRGETREKQGQLDAAVGEYRAAVNALGTARI